MKPFTLILAAIAALGAAGCGSADAGTTSADQDKAFKDGMKPTPVVIPPGANKPPANFKDSMPTGGPGGGAPPSAAGGPPPTTGG